jgi:hypothetical protein
LTSPATATATIGVDLDVSDPASTSFAVNACGLRRSSPSPSPPTTTSVVNDHVDVEVGRRFAQATSQRKNFR